VLHGVHCLRSCSLRTEKGFNRIEEEDENEVEDDEDPLPIHVVWVRGVLAFGITVGNRWPVDTWGDFGFEFCWKLIKLTVAIAEEHVVSSCAAKIVPRGLRVIDIPVGMP